MADDFEVSKKRRKTERYICRPLNNRRNEFRILQLSGARSEDGEQLIDATLSNVPFIGHPPYAALSYHWGDPEARNKILLNGKVHMITENLYQALLVLLHHQVSSLWVDGLCINQNDADEKAAQVGRMATIFQEAESVVIWLGPSSPCSDQMLGFLKDADSSQPYQGSWDQSLLTRNGYDTYLDLEVDLMDFLGRDYWRRTWVIQEIAVAQKIVLFCGVERLNGSLLDSLYSRTFWDELHSEARGWWTGQSRENLEHIVSLWHTRHSFRTRQPMDLLQLLLEHRSSEASLPLDRVYAILGLAFDQRAYVVEPNYTLGPEQLCVQMTQRFIKLTGSLDTIFLAKFVQSDLPTWCCPFVDFSEFKWHKDVVQDLISYINGKVHKLRFGEMNMFWNAADSALLTDTTMLCEGQTLKVIGLKLGKITGFPLSIETTRSTESHNHEWLRTIFDSISRLLMIHGQFYKDGPRLRSIVHRLFENILITPRLLDDAKGIFRICVGIGTTLAIYTDSEHKVRQLISSGEDEEDTQLSWEPAADEVQHAMETVGEHLKGGLFFFLVDSENVGSTPTFLRDHEDAEAWLLTGCSMPVLLRKLGHPHSPCYEIISEALVDSANLDGSCYRVMDGELWRNAKEEDFQWVTIL